MDKTARIWDAATGNELKALRGHENRLFSAVFSPDGTRIATASDDKTARIWDAETGTEIMVLRGHDDSVLFAGFSSDGTRAITASYDKTVRIWPVQFATMSAAALLHEACAHRLFGFSTLSRDEMELAGYGDATPEKDVCSGVG